MFFGDIYRGRRVLVTGHTGFKGSWLCEWLCRLGAEVYGISLPPPEGELNHFSLLNTPVNSRFIDIRSREELAAAVSAIAPEIVFHLAAQALVLESYRVPVETFGVNVMGTLHLLEALRDLPECRAVVVVTSDKCYDNCESGSAFAEDAPMGGRDPYSASKGCTELAVQAWRSSFFPPEKYDGCGMLIATARAGNVVGGGDWAADRLIPDMARAAAAGEKVILRHPMAVRPFQHVLEPLAGYLELGRHLFAGDVSAACGWNFGPPAGEALTVMAAAELFAAGWPEAEVAAAGNIEGMPPEAGLLRLDTGKAERELGIRNIWDEPELFRRTAVWYREFYRSGAVSTGDDLEAFTAEAAKLGAVWTKN